MRFLLAISLILLTSSPVWAQGYYTETSPQTYAGQPVYVPHDPYPSAPQPHAAQPQNSAPIVTSPPRPGEYGASVMTDIRQMNF